MFFGTSCMLLLTLAWAGVAADKWRWPEGVQTVRIDTKVRFIDAGERDSDDKAHRGNSVQADEVPFREPTNTEGFYNRPPGVGRYPVHVEQQRGHGVYAVHNTHHNSDGTLDSLQYCKCISTADCKARTDIPNACSAGKYLCCYKQPNKKQKTEFFNEVEDERSVLLPGHSNVAGPFPPPPNTAVNGQFEPGHGHETALIGTSDSRQGVQKGILIGPTGASSNFGPAHKLGNTNNIHGKPAILIGPQGPTGAIGPPPVRKNPPVLVGPDGPTGDIGPSESAQRGVLVGPGGPTGIIGPGGFNQRPVLVGPGGATGIIGPAVGQRPGVLVGPGGPTGIFGPFGYGRQTGRPGILVGPGGPTGIIGPGKQILVGSGGPTGQIGPRNYNHFGCSRRQRKEANTTTTIIKPVGYNEKKRNRTACTRAK